MFQSFPEEAASLAMPEVLELPQVAVPEEQVLAAPVASELSQVVVLVALVLPAPAAQGFEAMEAQLAEAESSP